MSVPTIYTRSCLHCGKDYTTVKDDQRFCQAKCRTAAWTAGRVQFKVKDGYRITPEEKARRAERARWSRLLNNLKGHMTYEEAKEWVRLGLADKMVRDLT